MRCPDCNKFVSFEDGDTELEAQDFDTTAQEDGIVTVSADVRMGKTCAECGMELAEYSFQLELAVDVTGHEDAEQHVIDVEFDEADPTDDVQGKRHYYGVTLDYRVMCSCTLGEPVASGALADRVLPSELESLV